MSSTIGVQNIAHTNGTNAMTVASDGGVYIKVGQHLATLDYLVPTEYIESLSSLFDSLLSAAGFAYSSLGLVAGSSSLSLSLSPST